VTSDHFLGKATAFFAKQRASNLRVRRGGEGPPPRANDLPGARVSASGFYAWQRWPPSVRTQMDRRLGVHLRAAHAASAGTYGSPRLQHQLQAEGLTIGRNRIPNPRSPVLPFSRSPELPIT
jgi:hypothetical protein